MELKKARIRDHWRRALRRNPKTKLKNITIEGQNIFSGLSLNFDSCISALVGRNGVGKSNLIRILYNSFVSENSNRAKLPTPLLQDYLVRFTLEVAGTEYEFSNSSIADMQESRDIPGVTGFIYDPCSLIPNLQALVLTPNFQEILEGYSEINLAEKDLRILNYLTNGSYTHVSMINVEEEYGEFSAFPFFRVKNRRADYDSASMGLGELSLFYFFWLIDYLYKIGKSGENVILFIEEPESFLPPSTQARLTDTLAAMVSDLGIPTVISSHSEHILKNIPRRKIHVMKLGREKIKCSISENDYEYIRLLGLTAKKKALLLFEDVAARELTRSILKFSTDFVPDSFYYHISGSEGRVQQDLSSLPNKLEDLRIIAVFDGDCRNHIEEYRKNIEGNEWINKKRYCLLPSSSHPEIILINFLEALQLEEACSILRVTEDKIISALESVAGVDPHDYFPDLAKELDLSFLSTFQTVCDAWAQSSSNDPELKKFKEAFYKLMFFEFGS